MDHKINTTVQAAEQLRPYNIIAVADVMDGSYCRCPIINGRHYMALAAVSFHEEMTTEV